MSSESLYRPSRLKTHTCPLWPSAIMFDHSLAYPKPSQSTFVFWSIPDTGQFNSIGFGDGSGKYAPISTSMRRCGWSVFSGHYNATVSTPTLVKDSWAYGPLPTLVQSTPIAELYAFYMYLSHAAPFEGMSIFHSDCSYVVDSWREKTHTPDDLRLGLQCQPMVQSMRACG